MLDPTALTLFIGPQTRLGHALNDCARFASKDSENQDVLILPNRVATRTIRHIMMSGAPLEDQKAEYEERFGNGGHPVVLSMLHVLGGAQTAFQKGELFPDSEVTLARLSALVGGRDTRIVATLDTLHHFFLAADTGPLHERVRKSGWEVLYELKWSDLVQEVVAAFPSAQILVLTPKGAAMQSESLLMSFFGEPFVSAHDTLLLARLCLGDDGVRQLDRLLEEDALTPEALEHLIESMPFAHKDSEVHEKLGIDRVTMDLLQQEFLSDLDVIERMPGVRVL